MFYQNAVYTVYFSVCKCHIVCLLAITVHHRLDVKLNMWSTGLTRSKDLKVTPLSEAAAIDIGAEMLSEAFVFFVGASKSEFIIAVSLRLGTAFICPTE